MIYLTAVLVITCLSFACAVYTPRIARVFGEGRAAQLALTVMEQAERLALDAIGFAEERARDEFKKTGRKLSGAAKLNLAIAFFRSHAGERVLAMFPRGVGNWIEAKLGMIRGMPAQPVESVRDLGTFRTCSDCPVMLAAGGPGRCSGCAERNASAGREDTQPQ